MKHYTMGIDTVRRTIKAEDIMIVDYLPIFKSYQNRNQRKLDDIFESIYPYYNFDLKSKNKTNRVFKDIDPYGEENWEE